MSDIIANARTYLLSKATVTAVVGQRIRSQVLDQNETLPAITLSLVTGDSAEHLGGCSGHVMHRVQVSCFAATSLAATSLREIVRLVLHGYRGSMGTLTITCVQHLSKIDVYEPPTHGESVGRFVAITDYGIGHAEPVPAF